MKFWKHVPGVQEVSIQLTDMPQPNLEILDESLEQKWDQMLEVRDEVLKALEEARKQKPLVIL